MAKCEICGKGVTFGIKVSHSHRRSNRTWKPNVRKVRAIVNGTPKSVNVCTRCLRSGKITRAVWFELKNSNAENFYSLLFFYSVDYYFRRGIIMNQSVRNVFYAMVELYSPDTLRIQHFTKVYTYASYIMLTE